MYEHKCESCIHGIVKIKKVKKYRNYPYGIYESTVLSTTCTLTWKNVRKLKTKCEDYKPKPNFTVKVKHYNGKKNVKVKQEALT